MSKNIFESFKNLFKREQSDSDQLEEGLHKVNLMELENHFESDDLVGCAIILKKLLEIYGEQKKKNHRQKGREFVHFILNSKHKDLKTVGYTHWQNINKIIHLNQAHPYPYHKKNLRKAIDFFKKEVKSLKAIDMVI